MYYSMLFIALWLTIAIFLFLHTKSSLKNAQILYILSIRRGLRCNLMSQQSFSNRINVLMWMLINSISRKIVESESGLYVISGAQQPITALNSLSLSPIGWQLTNTLLFSTNWRKSHRVEITDTKSIIRSKHSFTERQLWQLNVRGH